jgi:hypothetical protein
VHLCRGKWIGRRALLRSHKAARSNGAFSGGSSQRAAAEWASQLRCCNDIARRARWRGLGGGIEASLPDLGERHQSAVGNGLHRRRTKAASSLNSQGRLTIGGVGMQSLEAQGAVGNPNASRTHVFASGNAVLKSLSFANSSVATSRPSTFPASTSLRKCTPATMRLCP